MRLKHAGSIAFLALKVLIVLYFFSGSGASFVYQNF